MAALHLSYRLEQWGLRQPLQTSKGSISERTGIVLEVGERGDSREDLGLSVASPLPGWSHEECGDILNSLASLPTTLPSFDPAAPELCDSWLDEHQISIPSVRFGLSSALMDHCAKRTGRTWGALLAPSTGGRVEVARLCRSQEEAHAAYRQGARTLKLKAGMSLEHETKLVRAVAALGTDVTLRIDVNRGWTFEETVSAWDAWHAVHPRIEFLEEPLQAACFSRTTELQDYGIPLAFDESVRTKADVLNLAEQGLRGVVVLKPSLIGTPFEVLRLAQTASQIGFKAMVSNLIEPSVVRLYCAHLADLIGSGLAAGIGTGGLLADDFGELELKPDATVSLEAFQTSLECFS